MKNLFLSLLALTFITLGSVHASTINGNHGAVFVQDDKVKIKSEELPETVKTTLQGEAYKDWTISAAYHIKSSNQYELEMKKDAETKTVKLDKDGKVVE